MSTTAKCADCGEVLSPTTSSCPYCGSSKRVFSVAPKETSSFSDSRMRLRYRSGDKDPRGKCISEVDIKKKGNVETIIKVDRSRRLEGKLETDVYHEVIKDGELFHGPHLEPKKKETRKQ